MTTPDKRDLKELGMLLRKAGGREGLIKWIDEYSEPKVGRPGMDYYDDFLLRLVNVHGGITKAVKDAWNNWRRTGDRPPEQPGTKVFVSEIGQNKTRPAEDQEYLGKNEEAIRARLNRKIRDGTKPKGNAE
jgi:hypothetical protein